MWLQCEHRDIHVTIGIFVSRLAFQVSSMGCHVPEPLSVQFAKEDNAGDGRRIALDGEPIGGQITVRNMQLLLQRMTLIYRAEI